MRPPHIFARHCVSSQAWLRLLSFCFPRQAALNKTTRSRKEEEWLKTQLEKVVKRAVDLHRKDKKDLTDYEERVRG